MAIDCCPLTSWWLLPWKMEIKARWTAISRSLNTTEAADKVPFVMKGFTIRAVNCPLGPCHGHSASASVGGENLLSTFSSHKLVFSFFLRGRDLPKSLTVFFELPPAKFLISGAHSMHFRLPPTWQLFLDLYMPLYLSIIPTQQMHFPLFKAKCEFYVPFPTAQILQDRF